MVKITIESVFSEEINFIQQVFNYDSYKIIGRIIERLEVELEAYEKDNAEVYPDITDYPLISLIIEKTDLEDYEVKRIIETVEEAIADAEEFY